MKVKNLDLPEEVIEKFKSKGIEELNPPQKKAIEKGVLDLKNMIIASPTASGKTLIAEMAFLKTILEKNRKCIYIVPLKALASEKYQEFKEYEDLGIKIAISVGDLDSKDPWLEEYDLIIVTSEKMDSLLRHNPPWISNIGLIVADEIHLLNDESRGPTLEVVLTRLRRETNANIMGLSATISNAKEMSEWLNGKLVTSNYRPVELYEGVYDGNGIDFENKDYYTPKNNRDRGELSLVEDSLSRKKQALIFASTRRNAESIAEKSSKITGNFVKSEEELEKLAEKILNVPSQPTRQCKRLAKCVRSGSAFHHAGLQYKQKELIENAFREKLIKIISATPTLAMGINLPAWRVLIRDAKRYYPGEGVRYIPVLEYEQMSGRGGRPRYDSYGEAILIGKNEGEAEELKERFILGEAEEIYSKLSVEPILRMHTLSLIASSITGSEKSLKEFFSESFFAHQYGEISQIEEKLDRIMNRLKEQRFITQKNSRLKPTRIGKRVAELYLDPETAYDLINGLQSKKEGDLFSYLILISNTREMRPCRIKKREFDKIQEEIAKYEDILFQEPPSPWDLSYDRFLNAMKTALVLKEWCEEKGEDYLLNKYGITPGGLRMRIEIGDWLLYSSQELARLLNIKRRLKDIRKVRNRLKYGIKKELLPLIRLRGIGRVRARKLYSSGFKTISALKKVPVKRLESIIGEKTAKKVKAQLTKDKDKQETLE